MHIQQKIRKYCCVYEKCNSKTYELNIIQALESASVSECDTTVRFCCHKQGSVTIELALNRTGFTPGEGLLVNATITNDSQKTLKWSCAKLRQQVDYRLVDVIYSVCIAYDLFEQCIQGIRISVIQPCEIWR